MKIVTGNLWDYPADARVITTNGYITKSGTCVMGRGCAKEAAELFPGFPKALGEQIRKHGNHVYSFHPIGYDTPVVTFPVKHRWDQPADLDLIARSCVELAKLANKRPWRTIVLPRPGCGNGRLKWPEVKPLLHAFLDNRFHVITF